MLTKINKISDVLSLILDPVFYPCHNILSERSNKEAVPAMMPKKYEDQKINYDNPSDKP